MQFIANYYYNHYFNHMQSILQYLNSTHVFVQNGNKVLE